MFLEAQSHDGPVGLHPPMTPEVRRMAVFLIRERARVRAEAERVRNMPVIAARLEGRAAGFGLVLAWLAGANGEFNPDVFVAQVQAEAEAGELGPEPVTPAEPEDGAVVCGITSEDTTLGTCFRRAGHGGFHTDSRGRSWAGFQPAAAEPTPDQLTDREIEVERARRKWTEPMGGWEPRS